MRYSRFTAIVCLLIFGMLAVSSAFAQQARPSSGDANGPSLDVTMKCIQDALTGNTISSSFPMPPEGQPFFFTRKVTSASADPAACKIKWQEQMPLGDGALSIRSYEVVLGGIAKLRVVSFNELGQRTYSPDIYGVQVTAAVGKTFSLRTQVDWSARRERDCANVKHKSNRQNCESTKTILQDKDDTATPKEITVDFMSEDMANRMAKAMWHAVELCGGGEKSPF